MNEHQEHKSVNQRAHMKKSKRHAKNEGQMSSTIGVKGRGRSSIKVAGIVLTGAFLLAGCGLDAKPASTPAPDNAVGAVSGTPSTTPSSAPSTSQSGTQSSSSSTSQPGTPSTPPLSSQSTPPSSATGSGNGSRGGSGLTSGKGEPGGNTSGGATTDGGTASGVTSGAASGTAAGWTLASASVLPVTAYGVSKVPNFSPNAMQFVDASHGFLTGGNQLLATNDGGKSWSLRYTGKTAFQKLSFVSSTVGYAVMSDGTDSNGQPKDFTLFKTTDGGFHWASVDSAGSLPVNGLPWGYQYRVHFTTASDGWLLVSQSTQVDGNNLGASTGAYRTTDGGVTWTAMPLPRGAQTGAYADNQNGAALVGDGKTFSIEWTTDGGKNWTTKLTKSAMFEGGGKVWMDSPTDAWVQVDGGYGMMQQSYTLLHTSDAGWHWKILVASSTAGGGPAPGIPQADSNQYNRGPELVPGDLDVIDATHAVLPGVSLPSGQHGLVTTGWTADGGATWANNPEQMPGEQGIVSFVNPQQGWLVTSADKQLADVFATTDGGQKWSLEYQFNVTPAGSSYGKVTSLSYTASQLNQIGKIGHQDGVNVYLPTLGLDNEQFHIVKTNGDNSIGVVYDHIWLVESKQHWQEPTEPEVNYEETLANGQTAHYVETENQKGQLNKFLFFRDGDTYVTMEYLKPGSSYNDRQMVQVANSMVQLKQSGQ